MNAEVIGLIINALLICVVLYVGNIQKKQITGLEVGLKSQKEILDAMKTYFDIFRVDEVKKYVQLTQENTKKEAEQRANQIISELLNEKNKQFTQSRDAYIELMHFAVLTLMHVPPDARRKLVDGNSDQLSRSLLLKAIENSDAIYLSPESPFRIFDLLNSNSSNTKS